MTTDSKCEACGLYKTCGAKTPNLPSAGSENPSVYVIFQAPTRVEDEQGISFMGGSHAKLLTDSPLGQVPNASLRASYAVRCASTKADSRHKMICGQRIRDEIEKHRPDTILSFGKDVIPAVFPHHDPIVISKIPDLHGQAVPYRMKDGTLRPFYLFQAPVVAYAEDDRSFRRVWNRAIQTAIEGKSFDGEHHYWKENITYCLNMKQVEDCFKRLVSEPLVSFDFETTSLTPYKMEGKTHELWSVAFAFDGGDCFSIPLNDHWTKANKARIMRSLGKWFHQVNPDQIRVAHNLKFDLLWALIKLVQPNFDSVEFVGKYECTQLMTYTLNERPGTDSLKVAAFAYLGAMKWSLDVTNVRILPLMDCLKYNALDAFHTLRLYKELKPLIDADSSYGMVYNYVLVPATLKFIKVEMTGLDVNISLLREFHDDFESRLEAITTKGVELTGQNTWNFNKRETLIDYFAKQNYDVGEYLTPSGGISTAEKALSHFAETFDDPVAKLTLEYRNLEKLQSTYILGLHKHIFADGKIHANFKVPATVTGRTSSSKPNMQNFPKRKNVEIRKLITPPEGKVLVSFDYGQIEARLFAVVSGDQNYLADLYDGYDIHKEKAIDLFHGMLGWSVEDAITMRSKIKGDLVFASFYGAGVRTVARGLGIEEHQAQTIIDSIFTRYSRIKEWKKEVVKFEEKYGYVESLFGRRRRAPMEPTKLLNHMTQSTASDMTLISMNYLANKYDCVIMIHDDLSFILDDDESLPHVIAEITRAMLTIPWVFLESSQWMRSYAPLQVDCSVGKNWCDMNEVSKIDSVQLKLDTLEDSVLAGREYMKQLGSK